jgi:hypothetical protein
MDAPQSGGPTFTLIGIEDTLGVHGVFELRHEPGAGGRGGSYWIRVRVAREGCDTCSATAFGGFGRVQRSTFRSTVSANLTDPGGLRPQAPAGLELRAVGDSTSR